MGLNLESTISLNSASFERGMNRVKGTVVDSIKNFAIGAIGIATVEQAFARTIETANELVNTAKRLGTTVEQVQLLRQAAKDAGTEMDSVATALEKINQARAKALGGDKAASAAFGALGVSQTDLKTKTAADLFMHEISETVKKVSPEQIAQPLREVLGRGAGQGIAVLKTDFDELGSKMNLMSTKTAASLNQLSKDFDLISGQIIVAMAPAILVMLQACIKFADWVGSKIGGAAAWWGAETAFNPNDMSAPITDPVNAGHADAIRRAGNAGAPDSAHGYAFGEQGDPAKAAVENSFKKWLEDFNLSLKKAADNLKNPKPDFSATADTAQKMKGGGRIESDSLVKVGNFLGSNVGAVSAAERLIQNSQRTVSLLQQLNATLSEIKIALPKSSFNGSSNGSLGFGSLSGPYEYGGIMSLMTPPNT